MYVRTSANSNPAHLFSRRRQLMRLSLSLFLIVVLRVPLMAQSAAVNGQVKDASGATVPNAQITLTNETTSAVRRSVSAADGLYQFQFVQPGTYTVGAEAPNFKPYKRINIVVQTGQTLAIDLDLQVGDAKGSVTVNGSGIQVNTTDAAVSTVVDQQFIQDIPLNGRSFQSLIASIPGVSYVPTGNGNAAGGGLSVNGQRTEENYYTIDGVSANVGKSYAYGDPGFGAGYSASLPNLSALGTTQTMLSLDSLEEFRASTSTYCAEYGRMPGGQFSFTSRSGTNAWHGSASDYLRNGALDANNWFNNELLVPRQAERQNDFGGTLGGPVRISHLYNGADKTFFFLSYEGLRLTSPSAAQTYYVPSMALRQEAPPALQPILDAYPLPTGPDLTGSFTGLANFTAGFSTPSSINSTGLRVDHIFNEKLRVFGRFAYSASDSNSRGTSGSSSLAILQTLSDQNKALTLGSTFLLTPHITNELRFGYTDSYNAIAYAFTNFGGATVPDLSNVIPEYNPGESFLSTAFSFGGGYFNNYLYPDHDTQYQINVVDTTAWSIGRHNIKFGIDYRRTHDKEYDAILAEYLDFESLNSILTGTIDDAYIYTDDFWRYSRPVYMNISAFVQDEWKVTSRLNLSLGLRWELDPAPVDSGGYCPLGITQATDLATTMLAPRCAPLWHTTYANFAPRIGLAYRLRDTQGQETVIRAGFGIFFDTANQTAEYGYEGVGCCGEATLTEAAFPITQTQLNQIVTPDISPPYDDTIYSYDPRLKLPYTLEWNFALQQNLGSRQTFSATYLGSGGRRLLGIQILNPYLDGNQAFSEGNDLDLLKNAYTSSYNALQIQFQRRLSRGLQATAAYTWSHSIDDSSTNYYTDYLMRASSDFDIRNNFQVALTYDLPRLHGNSFGSALLSGWGVDSRISARSSLPVNVYASSTFSPLNGQLLYLFPNYVAGQPEYLYGQQYPGGRIINSAAFVKATNSAGTAIQGDVGRNSARAFDAVQADVSLRREFRLSERVGLQFRAEAFNLLNHPIFGDVYNYLPNGPAKFGWAYDTESVQLGTLSSLYQQGGPRSLQLALKLHF